MICGHGDCERATYSFFVSDNHVLDRVSHFGSSASEKLSSNFAVAHKDFSESRDHRNTSNSVWTESARATRVAGPSISHGAAAGATGRGSLSRAARGNGDAVCARAPGPFVRRAAYALRAADASRADRAPNARPTVDMGRPR